MQFAKQTDHRGINMTLVGQWIDLAAYYRGDDGNAWSYQPISGYGGNWSNEGPIGDFLASFASRRRGKLLNPPANQVGQPMS